MVPWGWQCVSPSLIFINKRRDHLIKCSPKVDTFLLPHSGDIIGQPTPLAFWWFAMKQRRKSLFFFFLLGTCVALSKPAQMTIVSWTLSSHEENSKHPYPSKKTVGMVLMCSYSYTRTSLEQKTGQLHLR